MILDEGGGPALLGAGSRNVLGGATAARLSTTTLLRAGLLLLPAAGVAALIFYVIYASLVAEADAAAYAARLAKGMALAWIAVVILLGALTAAAAHEATQREEAESDAARLRHEIADERSSLDALRGEMESFSYAVSHDVRAPLRGIDGFALALLEDHGDALNDEARDGLTRVRNAAQRMGELIDDLVMLSWVARADLKRERNVDISAIASKVAGDLRRAEPERNVEFRIGGGVAGNADRRLLRLALESLLGNAWKFSAGREPAIIEFGQTRRDGAKVCFVRDNGVGFDMAHAGQLFQAFRRLHPTEEFGGRGIGLAIVNRIVAKHGGRVWVEAENGKGAAFYFTLQKDANS